MGILFAQENSLANGILDGVVVDKELIDNHSSRRFRVVSGQESTTFKYWGAYGWKIIFIYRCGRKGDAVLAFRKMVAFGANGFPLIAGAGWNEMRQCDRPNAWD